MNTQANITASHFMLSGLGVILFSVMIWRDTPFGKGLMIGAGVVTFIATLVYLATIEKVRS